MLESRVLGLFEQRLKKLDLPLGVRLWNGAEFNPTRPSEVKVSIRSPQALSALARPTLGKLARAYVEEEIDLDGDMRATVELGEKLIADDATGVYRKTSDIWKWWRHTRPADRKAVQQHYDVGNDFYALWLDKNRVYSCAYYQSADDSLDKAQEQKLEHICRKLDLKAGERMLDIGCGWGGLIMWAARNHGVRALGITLSQEQFDYVREQIRSAGLEGRCEVKLMDYRDLPESDPFDKVASVGMFEHVGKRNLPTYFAKIFRILKPGGLVMNHGITTNSLDDGELASGIGEFVDQYVFPGGELVHLSRVLSEMSRQGLETWDTECLRPHYARTLWEWVRRLEERKEDARRLVGEKRLRTWRIYMAGSAHAFDRGWISIFQILAGKPGINGRLPYPLTRGHLYA